MSTKNEKGQYPKRACLSGRDIVALLEGRIIPAHGTEFAYDGTEASRVVEAAQTMLRKEPRKK